MIYFKNASDSKENPLSDSNNPDVEQRKKPLVGVVFLKDVIDNESRNLWKGKLYDYDGNTYNSYLRSRKMDQLTFAAFGVCHSLDQTLYLL